MKGVSQMTAVFCTTLLVCIAGLAYQVNLKVDEFRERIKFLEAASIIHSELSESRDRRMEKLKEQVDKLAARRSTQESE